MKKFPIRLRWIILAALIAPAVVLYHLNSSNGLDAEAEFESSRLPLLLLVLVVIFVVGTIIEDITTRKPPKE